MWLGKGGWLQVRETDRQLALQREANAKLKARNEALDADVRDLKTGSEAIEERARSELGMIKRTRCSSSCSRAWSCRRCRRPRPRPRGRPRPSRRRRTDAMLRATSRHNPRLKDAARLIASSRDRRKSGRCVLEGEHLIGVYQERIGAPETLLVVEDALHDPRLAALVARMPERDVIAVPAALFAEVSHAARGHRRARDRAHARAERAAAGALPPAARRRAGSGQRRHHAAHRRGGGRGAGAAVARLRVRVVAQGAARGAGRALPARPSSRTSTCRRGAPRSARDGGHVVAAVAAGGARPLRAPAAAAAGGGDRQRRRGPLGRAARAGATCRSTIPMPGGMESLNAAAAAAVVLFEALRCSRAAATVSS